MKLYEIGAPNPRRVRIFLAEKNAEIESVTVDVMAGAHQTPAFLEKNSLGLLPVLELDDGTCITESVAICRYLESHYPEPPLLGMGPLQQAVVEMWNRRLELGLFRSTADYFQHTIPFFKDKIAQLPAYAETAKESARKHLDWLNGALADRKFLAGDDYTIADITAQVALDLGTPSVFTVEPRHEHLSRWLSEVSARPSARVLGKS